MQQEGTEEFFSEELVNLPSALYAGYTATGCLLTTDGLLLCPVNCPEPSSMHDVVRVNREEGLVRYVCSKCNGDSHTLMCPRALDSSTCRYPFFVPPEAD